MKVGLISDVHASAPALNAVMGDMPPVDEVVHAGDVVGYNPYPNAVVDTFRREDVASISGNHDRAVAGGTDFGFHSVAGQAVEWTRDALREDCLEYVEELREEREPVDGVYLAHGAPGAPDRYTYPEEFTAELLPDGVEVLVLGHTHVQGKEEFEEGIVVNPGSVGQPRDGDPRAAYAVLDLSSLEVELRRVEYPIERVQENIRREEGLPDSLADRLERGL